MYPQSHGYESKEEPYSDFLAADYMILTYELH